MDIKQAVRPGRLLGLAPLGLIVIMIHGCEVPQGAYRKMYGPGISNWDNYRDSGVAPYPTPEIAAPENEGAPTDAPGTDKPPGAPIKNPGRPEPPPSKIPGIADIPEIPDEPRVLQE